MVLLKPMLLTQNQKITCATAGELDITVPTGSSIVAGTVFAYLADSAGDEKAVIAGGVFTATTEGDIAVDTEYAVSYILNRTGTKKVSFNSKKNSKDYFITMSTVDKDEDGVFTPFKQTFYKATPQRNFELALSLGRDPASVKLEFNLLEDSDGNILDMIELTYEAIEAI